MLKKFGFSTLFQRDLLQSKYVTYAGMIFSIIIVFVVWTVSQEYFDNRAQRVFEYHVHENLTSIERRIQKYENVLRSGVGFLQGSDNVSREEWYRFIQTLDTKQHYPGIQGIGFSMMLLPDEVERIESKMHSDGYPSFALKPKGARDQYSAILYLEPLDRRNRSAIGYDMFSEPVRKEAMERARDTGLAAISGKVKLVQEIDSDVQAGFLMYLPYYNTDEKIDSVEERRKSLVGFVYSPFRMNNLMRAIDSYDDSLRYEIYDGEKRSENNLLYRSFIPSGYISNHEAHRSITIGGRKWHVYYTSSPEFDASTSSQYPFMIALSGLIFYFLLLYIILELVRNRKMIQIKTEELKESEAFYRTIFSSINEAVCILEEDIIIDCNDKAIRLFEMTKQHLIGLNIVDTVDHIECRENSFAFYLNSAYHGDSTTMECSLTLNKHSSEIKIVEITLSGFGGNDKNKLVMIARDITARVEEERIFRMQTRQAQMGEMISMIAHQWRQPLAIINAITSQMRLIELMKEENDLLFIDNLIKIEEQSTHLSQTISAYRDFFRPDKPKEHFNISMLLNNALSLIDHTLKNHGIKIEKVVKHDFTLLTYRNEILQVMIALLKNSLDAFVENGVLNGQLLITLDQDYDYGIITINDNAGGIPPAVIHKLFIPYFTTKTKNNGTGLGLYMSKIIIEEHCGGIIETLSEGNETTFIVKLPREKEGL